jgi:hypothetical protein
MHHIASDGWSISILANELVKIYNGYANGKQIDLPELPIQYADYAIWQRNYLKDELLDKLLSYWKQKLNETVPLDLPLDFPRPPVQSRFGASLGIDIDNTSQRKIK